MNKGICRSVTSSEKGMKEDENHCYTFAALSCAGIAAAVRPAPQVSYIKGIYRLGMSLYMKDYLIQKTV